MSHRRLFLASCMSLATCGVLFAIRNFALDDLVDHFSAATVKATHQQVGDVFGIYFYGFGVVILIASPLCDLLGMRLLLTLAFILHVVGIGGFMLAPGVGSDQNLFWAKATMFCTGLAHGLIEGVINPLVATLYPEQKTKRLNTLHAWWPGGIVLGGIAAYVLARMGWSWQALWCLGFAPALLYGLSIVGAQFPKTERVASGVSAVGMVTAALNPVFLLFVALMAVTGATELGTGTWLNSVLAKTVPNDPNFKGILLLVYGSILMFVMRLFAGPIAHKLSPIGLLAGSTAVATVGLFLLSITDSAGLGFAAATVFYVGVCYCWPTMLGVVSERFPRTGALGMGLMGGSGINGSGFFTSYMGGIYDTKGPAAAFQFATFLPLGATVVFAVVWLAYRARGGYRVERLVAAAAPAGAPAPAPAHATPPAPPSPPPGPPKPPRP